MNCLKNLINIIGLSFQGWMGLHNSQADSMERVLLKERRRGVWGNKN